MKKIVKLMFVFFLFLSVIVQNTYSQGDEILFRRHLVVSGFHGLLYGSAFDYIFGIKGAAAAGLPVIAAGSCVVVPLLTNSSKTMTSNQLFLSSHGQTLGWAHGFALGALINGNDAFNSESKSKLTIGLGAATSIGLGILGNHLGKTKDWSEGRVAIYRHYGWIMPMSGLCVAASFSDDARMYGAIDLVSAAGGYLLADQVNKWNEFTRGEIRATQFISSMTGALGLCIFVDSQINQDVNAKRAGWLLPAAGLLVGTGVGHLWLKDANFTPQQGMTTIYAGTGGTIIGLGIALLTKSDKMTPYYVIPYITGMGAYTLVVQKLKKNNVGQAFLPANHKAKWDFAFMPQNLFLNNKIAEKGFTLNGRQTGMQPLFYASFTF
jgi:hypothetical protein